RDPKCRLVPLAADGDAALSVRVLRQDKTACGNMPRLSVARLVLCTAVEPDGKHALGHLMPTDFANVRRYAGEADTQRRTVNRKFERRDTAKDQPRGVWDVHLVKMGLSVGCGANAGALHCQRRSRSFKDAQHKAIPYISRADRRLTVQGGVSLE